MAPAGRESSPNVTLLLKDWQAGDKAALDQLTPVVYTELRRLAQSYLRKERAGHTLQPTALVHEAYVRLVDQSIPQFQSRSHFFAISAHLMRQIIVDFARRHRTQKRGSGKQTSLDGLKLGAPDAFEHFLDIHEALDRLAAVDERRSRVIELKYFAGLQREEIAEAIGISLASVKRDLMLGEAWLRRELAAGETALNSPA
jgi:RNA polymerase sigma-70 factor (ECF subfamily)